MRGMNHNMSASREKKKRQEQTSAESTSALESKKGMNKTVKTVLYAVIAVVLVAVIVFLGMVTSGFFITHTTAALANGHKLTPAMVNYYYASSYQEIIPPGVPYPADFCGIFFCPKFIEVSEITAKTALLWQGGFRFIE